MKKANLNLPELSRRNALKCGALALALVAMTGCKDDAPDTNGPAGTDVVETVDGIDLSGRMVINLCLGIYIAQAEDEEFSVVDAV